MGIETMGKRIAALRKESGVKQDELASFVGVSTQAVSKWENGGAPDIELLPKIADFFSVSVDYLFGRSFTDYSDMQSALIEKVNSAPPEQQFKQIFNYCWDMERALMANKNSIERGSIEDYENELDENAQRYSSMMSDYGFTRMGIANRLQYFLIVPETRDTDAAYFNGIDYPAFFKDFSDADVFYACVMLHKREGDKAFTENLLVNKLKIDVDKAKQILIVLEKYNLIYKTQIEMDDEIQTVYNFRPTPSFAAFLIFAREMIKTPNYFIYYSGGRKKPYLK